jgi:sporulation protein YabP
MHSLIVEDRKQITVTDVKDVNSFNEESITLLINGGGLVLKGQDMHIQKLDLGEGKVIVNGSINSAVYTEKREKTEGGFLKKMLK